MKLEQSYSGSSNICHRLYKYCTNRICSPGALPCLSGFHQKAGYDQTTCSICPNRCGPGALLYLVLSGLVRKCAVADRIQCADFGEHFCGWIFPVHDPPSFYLADMDDKE